MRAQGCAVKGFGLKSLVALAGSIVTVALCLATSAFGCTDLIKSNPTADATVTPLRTLILTFSEKVGPTRSRFDLGMGDGMKLPLITALLSDGAIITGTLRGPLMQGTYKLTPHTDAAADGHRADGSFLFKVR